ADGRVVVSLSRLVPRKGMDVLVEAVAELAPDRPDLVLAIGGAGRDRRRLERLIDRTGAPARLLGRVPDQDLPALYGCADVYAMLCRNRWAGLEQEGFGIVFLEAAACGVPQVAGASGGAHEAVADGETGLVVRRPRARGGGPARRPAPAAPPPRRRGRAPPRAAPPARRPGGGGGGGGGGPPAGRAGLRLRRAGRAAGGGARPVVTAGEGLVRLDVRATAVFTVVAAAAAAFPGVGAYVAVPVALVLFVAGCATFLWAYAVAVGRSRYEQLSLGGLFFLGEDVAPPRVARTMRLALAVQVVAAVAAAAVRPYTAVAFTVLAPMFGLGMMALWGARHGRFPERQAN